MFYNSDIIAVVIFFLFITSSMEFHNSISLVVLILLSLFVE